MPKKYTVFVHMNATKEWLSLTRAERSAFAETELNPILGRYPSVSVRFYDVEAFRAACSDIAVFETNEMQDYAFLIDALRDSKVYTVPYFEITDIFPSIEEGFIRYDEHQARR